jgi:glutathione reductase (NADPH)
MTTAPAARNASFDGAFDYDLFVIGAGSGGVRAARIAANHGARVAIAEEFKVGGTCVIRGCVPKKLLSYASRFHGEFEDAAGFGWTVGKPTFDWATLIANKDREITRLEAAYRANLERSKVTVLATRAVLAGPHAVRLGDGRVVTAKTILIATGGTPNIDPKLPGRELAITSNEAFHLATLPRRILIAGGGYIAVEFACIFAGLGADTTLIYRGAKILRGFDEDVRDDLTAAMGRRGVRIVTGKTIKQLKAAAGGIHATLSDGTGLDLDQVMFAIGRSPNTQGLGLDTVDVACAESGAILVDRHGRTNVESIYAAGDVTDRVNLTPVAIREGHAIADTLYGGKSWSVDHTLIPTAVFSEPEIGTVGLSEIAARASHGAIDVYKARFRPMKYTLAGRDERMLMKLVVDSASQKVLGCHVLGPDAAEIVQMAAIAMRMGATKADFDATMALHPSAAEELVTMRDKWVAPS